MTTSAPGDPLSLVGKTLAGHFLVQSLAAEGHTSIVYRGEHVGPKRPVALKCLKIKVDLDAARADTFLKRLREETRAYSQASRNEAHFVRSIGTGMTAIGNGTHVPYSVLEWLEGRTLAFDCKRRKDSGAPLRTLAEVADLLAPTARALASVHLHKLAHGDVSSRNVFLLNRSAGGFSTKLLDFGVAKVVRDVSRELTPSALTAPIESDPFWIPSPGYAAPEQLNRALGDVGTWTDVYAFAIVFLEAMLDRPLGTPVPPLATLGLNLPETVEQVLSRALLESPKDRWPGAGEFWAAFEDSLRVSAVRIPSRPPIAATPAAPLIGAQTLRLGAAVPPTPPAGPVVGASAGPVGAKTMRMGGPPPPMPARAAPAKPALLPAAATRVPPAAGMKPEPITSPSHAPVPPAAIPDDQKPILGTPVLFANPIAPQSPPKPPPPGAQTRPMTPDAVKAALAASVPTPLPSSVPAGLAPVPSPPPPPPGEGGPPSSKPASGPTSGPSSVPPPPPPPGAILAVAPGPLPLPPPPQSTSSPASENKRSVSAAAPATRAVVSMESLPSVIVDAPEAPPAPRPPPPNAPTGADTVRLHNPLSGPISASFPISSNQPISPNPAGLPALPPRPGVIMMPASMDAMRGAPAGMQEGDMPSRRRLSYDERREKERKRLFAVMFVSFAVVFVVGAVALFHFVRGRAPAASMSAHSASN